MSQTPRRSASGVVRTARGISCRYSDQPFSGWPESIATHGKVVAGAGSQKGPAFFAISFPGSGVLRFVIMPTIYR